eukprot:266029-Prorocentrum_minimum.AAC.1
MFVFCRNLPVTGGSQGGHREVTGGSQNDDCLLQELARRVPPATARAHLGGARRGRGGVLAGVLEGVDKERGRRSGGDLSIKSRRP